MASMLAESPEPTPTTRPGNGMEGAALRGIKLLSHAISAFNLTWICGFATGICGPGGSETGQHLPGVPLRFHLGKNPGDPAIRADHERSPLDPHHFLAVHVLLFVYTVRLGGDFIHVA